MEVSSFQGVGIEGFHCMSSFQEFEVECVFTCGIKFDKLVCACNKEVIFISWQFLKYMNLRNVYSLEFTMWVLFAFGPYFFAEGLKLSGIMAVLFCGIVMSHYTHFNLSPITQVTVQQTMRTVSFMAGMQYIVFLSRVQQQKV